MSQRDGVVPLIMGLTIYTNKLHKLQQNELKMIWSWNLSGKSRKYLMWMILCICACNILLVFDDKILCLYVNDCCTISWYSCINVYCMVIQIIGISWGIVNHLIINDTVRYFLTIFIVLSFYTRTSSQNRIENTGR